MKNFYVRLVLFLILNFGALAIGSALMAEGPMGEWYTNLNKAPWTPPGWVFGAAWTTIMICFSFYMAYWTALKNDTTTYILYGLQLILNIGWNPAFFMFHQMGFALVVIISLTLLIAYFLFSNNRLLKTKSLLIVPYLLWLVIATTLNAYALMNN